MGEGGRKVEMAGAEDTENDDDADVDGAAMTVGAEDVEGVGANLAEGRDVLEPSEKKSAAGAADFRGCVDAAEAGILDGPSFSRDIFALPFLREGGRNDVDGPGTSVGPSTAASSAPFASTGGPSVLVKPAAVS